MKCENCGKNEVSFLYRSNVNGKIEEKRLCADCAEKLGYTQRIAAQGRSMMQGMFGGDGLFGRSFFGGGLLDGFFPTMPALMGRMLDDPFDDFFADMPALGAAPAVQEEKKEEEHLVAKEEKSRFERWRELNALKLEMRKAVHTEDFERAAQIRDQIREIEARSAETK